MELSKRINRQFIILSSIAFVVMCLSYYFIIDFVLQQHSKTVLSQKTKETIHTLTFHPEWRGMPPYILVEKDSNKVSEKRVYDYTAIADSTLQRTYHLKPYRLLQQSLNIRGQGYHLKVTTPLTAEIRLKWHLLFIFAALLSLLLYGLYRFKRKFLARTLLPLQQSLGQVKQFNVQSNEKPVLQDSKVNEFKEINKEFEVLMVRIQQDYSDLKAFTESAAHELQIPVAIIRKKIESLLEEQNMTEEQSLKLVTIYEQINRISILNANLLILTKVENKHFEKTAAVDASKLLSQLWDAHLDLVKSKHLKLQQDIQTCRLDCNEELLFIAFKNLLENAVKYSPEGGKLAVYLNQKSIIIGNSGENALVHSQQLYGQPIKGQNWAAATGLGLAIVKQITDICGWELRYRFEHKMHFFEVVFTASASHP